jgi:hypothetical protein
MARAVYRSIPSKILSSRDLLAMLILGIVEIILLVQEILHLVIGKGFRAGELDDLPHDYARRVTRKDR